MIRILVCDDHWLEGEGIQILLERAPDIRVVEQAHDGWQAVQLALELQPNLVTMDLHLPGLNGLDATRQITAHTHAHVLMVCLAWNEDLVREAFESGAQGYVAKFDLTDDLIAAVRAVCRGETFLSSTILHQFRKPTQIENPRPQPPSRRRHLFPRWARLALNPRLGGSQR